jgi:MSHA pilin protein MshD
MRRCPRHRGFTLVEAAVSTVVVGLMLAAAVNTAGAARSREQRAAEQQRGMYLAQSLLSEVLSKPYVDAGVLPLMGREADELLSTRADYDDVDDYNALSDSPPRDAAGAALAGYTGWTRSVSVQFVVAGLATTSGSDTGLKRITVTIKRGERVICELTALRSKARDSQ